LLIREDERRRFLLVMFVVQRARGMPLGSRNNPAAGYDVV